MITFHEVSKSFQKKQVIYPLSFTVEPGECIALCGGNGAGKSTIIKMMTGIYTPDSGEILLNGHKSGDRKTDFRSQFAYMPDDLSAPPLLTGRETLTYFADLQKADRQQVDELLALVGLSEHADKKVKSYSKGMQQRLSFAQSLLSKAPILILDEPTNGLDPYWVHRMKEIIIEKKNQGQTILFTTHILSVVEEIADTLAFLQEGRLLVHQKVETLLDQHASLDEALFKEYSK
ncbi:ABC transporter ATP-binding protein [Bacillus sp. REN10]|uniref:ABC transporter ATP-binding protein n=1 Tax=Bacillus sp. REN10 TaxID=2782541 RepID=UPI00193C59FA|nr:ABC transporter ATP-binding protein [Bacillus sp. REN10]